MQSLCTHRMRRGRPDEHTGRANRPSFPCPRAGGVRGGWEGVSPVSSSHERQSTRDSGGFVKRFEFEKGDGGIEPCILAIGIGSLPPHPCLYFVHCHRPLCTMSKASFACQLGEIHAWQVRDCSKKAQVVVTSPTTLRPTTCKRS